MAWQASKDGFIEADVIRWTEAIWPPSSRRRRRRPPRPVGKQEVTAQIAATDGDYLSLKVIKAEIKESSAGMDRSPYKKGSVIRKKRQTLLKGSPERLLWSEESVRAALMEYPVHS